MIFSDLGEQYYDWLHKIVCGEWEPRNLSFHRLLMYLHNRTYVWACEMDQCRAEDGVNLRYRFARECDIPYGKIDAEFHGVPCSMLEMMVPLRCASKNILWRIPVRETVSGSGSGTWLSVSGLLPWTTAGFTKTGQIIFWTGLSAETMNTMVPAVSLQ